MVSNATWIVFAQLIIFNPQGNGDKNELTEFKQKRLDAKSMPSSLMTTMCSWIQL